MTDAPITVVQDTPLDPIKAPLKRKELMERIMAKTGLRQSEVKPIAEATLEVLAEALLAGEPLQVAPLGKIKVTKSKTVANAHVLTLRMRNNNNVSER